MTLHYCIQFLSRFLKLKYRGRSRNSNNLWSFMKDRNPHTEIYGCILYDLRTSVSNYYLENKHKLQILYGQLSSNTIYITTVIFCWRYSFTFVGFDRPTHRPKQSPFFLHWNQTQYRSKGFLVALKWGKFIHVPV